MQLLKVKYELDMNLPRKIFLLCLEKKKIKIKGIRKEIYYLFKPKIR